MRDRDAPLRTRRRVIISRAGGLVVRLEAMAFRRRDAGHAGGRVRVRLEPCGFDVGAGPVFGV
jgi:hypothetical protein